MKKIILLTFMASLVVGVSHAQVPSANGTFTATGTSNLSLRTTTGILPTTRLTILRSNGNVGIGITTPSYKLEVNGTLAASTFNSTNGTFNVASTTSNFLLQLNSATRMTVLNSNGFVGINKATPLYQLDVNGPINATGFLINGTPFTGGAGSQWTTAGTAIYYNTGNVGIGTTTPSEMFHVNGNILTNQVTSSNGIYNAGGTSNLSFKTNNTDRLSVLSTNGFVGIGTTTPTEMLQVNGTVLSTLFSSSTGNFNSATNLTLQTAGSPRLSVLNANGNVGIGSTSPEDKLHVMGNMILDNGSNPMIYTGSGSAENGRYLHVTNSVGLPSASGMKAGGLLVSDTYTYANPSKNDLVVKGKVGIGTPLTTNPNDYTLAVNGKIGAKDVQVERNSGTWPDYVFKSDFNLPSLVEVEKYIQENNHLKDVPSAEEIKNNGHSLGEMDEILLKKIEELTLYIIAQQKEIDALKKSTSKRKLRSKE